MKPEIFGGNTCQAIIHIEKAIKLNPDHADSHVWLGMALRKDGRESEAIACFKKALSLNQENKFAETCLKEVA